MARITSRYLDFTFALFILGMMTVTSAAAGPPLRTFRSIDVPGAQQTRSLATNDRGMTVGVYGRPADQGLSTGFVRIGRFITEIKHPEDVSDFPTSPQGINDRGEIAGIFFEGVNAQAFLLSRGEFTTISIPDSRQSRAFGINNQGKVVGSFFDDIRRLERGFVFDGGAITIIDVPGSFVPTEAVGINDKDQIVGNFTDSSSASHGFLLAGGVYQIIDMPNSVSTSVKAINNRGQIVGSYRVSSPEFVDFGFLLYRGKFTTIDLDIPNSDFATLSGINNHGQITGYYFDNVAQKGRGFTVDAGELTD